MSDLAELAGYLRARDEIDSLIARVVGRSTRAGDVGEFTASRVFDIELAETVIRAGHDGWSDPRHWTVVGLYGDVNAGIDIGAHPCGIHSGPQWTGGNGTAPAGAVGLNQPARDGKFEFTATKVECGIAHVGGEYLNKKAQGQFCLVNVTVKNIGNEARTFNDSSQYAYNVVRVVHRGVSTLDFAC